ncbi:uroporphyrinogen-III synthase [Rasiella sp. SM2506]|uniref:uroporphyrinogen-III synthase n=1 Tax=Rasiella sp. SM2506 TaxID=3423914 RepID=UPI003D7AB16E
MASILSTKKLKPNQRDLLLGAGFSVVDYNAIGIEFLDFEMPSEIKNGIFTSQNSVRALINNSEFTPSQWERAGVKVFCVGQKTKALLEQNKLKVVKTTDYGEDLADFITKNHKNDSFHFFCGTIRREEIPKALLASKIEFIEVKTYKTTLKPKKFVQKWNGILFFSPSAVESFATENKIDTSIAFCIGKTTAAEAQKYTSNVVVANTTSVESVIAKAVKTLK